MIDETTQFPRVRDDGYTDRLGAIADELRARAGMWRAVRALGWLAFWTVFTALILGTAFAAGIVIQLIGAAS